MESFKLGRKCQLLDHDPNCWMMKRERNWYAVSNNHHDEYINITGTREADNFHR
jgi:hypothetical protein